MLLHLRYLFNPDLKKADSSLSNIYFSSLFNNLFVNYFSFHCSYSLQNPLFVVSVFYIYFHFINVILILGVQMENPCCVYL